MQVRIILLGVIAIACARMAAAVEVSNANMTITGQLTGTLSVTIENAPGSVAGGATSAASSSFGNVSKYGGVLPSNVSRTVTATDWTLTSSYLAVKVTSANLSSTTFTLSALLNSSPAANVTWKLNGNTLSTATPVVVTSTGTYGNNVSLTLNIVMLNAVSGAIDNTLRFTATAN